MAPDNMRVSVTDLDGWEYYKSSNLSHSEFLRRLRRMDPPSKAMHDGTMFHRYMETQGREFSHFFEWKCDVTMEKPTATEVPVTKKYEIGGRVVTLSGRVDAIEKGVTVIDYKLMGRPPEFASMADAWQWRAYLAMLPECVDFRYDCFVKGYHSKTRPPSVVPIKAYEPIRLNRYDGLERDVEQQLGAYVTYLLELARAGDIRLGVRGVLTEKQEANALDLDSPLDYRIAKWHEVNNCLSEDDSAKHWTSVGKMTEGILMETAWIVNPHVAFPDVWPEQVARHGVPVSRDAWWANR